jgi:hypothetical protein
LSSPDDPGFFSDAVRWIIGIATTLIALVWGDMRHRVHKIEMKLENKAENEEMDRLRDQTTALFEGQVEIRREIQSVGEKMTSRLHQMHVDLLIKIEERKNRR